MYDQGVEAVTATLRQLYEMIEVEDERVQRLVASATAAHRQRIEQLSGRINRLEAELSSRVRHVHQLSRTVKDLNKQLKEARQQTRLAREAHLATVLKNSQNSSLPPSRDPHKRTRSLREQSGRKPGGQAGHRGATKEMVAKPDYLVIHAPESCSLCGSSLNGADVAGSERRQVHDLPPQMIEVTEHKAAVAVASGGGKKRLAVRQEKEFLSRYDRIVSEVGKLYQPLKRKKYRATTRHPRESPIVAAARKLMNRLAAKRDQILLFMTDFKIPFDNNQAERDLRMLKVKQKVSGCFRTDTGAEEFCRMRSYISTMKKQGHGIMESIKSVYAGATILPALRC